MVSSIHECKTSESLPLPINRQDCAFHLSFPTNFRHEFRSWHAVSSLNQLATYRPRGLLSRWAPIWQRILPFRRFLSTDTFRAFCRSDNTVPFPHQYAVVINVVKTVSCPVAGRGCALTALVPAFVLGGVFLALMLYCSFGRPCFSGCHTHTPIRAHLLRRKRQFLPTIALFPPATCGASRSECPANDSRN